MDEKCSMVKLKYGKHRQLNSMQELCYFTYLLLLYLMNAFITFLNILLFCIFKVFFMFLKIFLECFYIYVFNKNMWLLQ